MRPKPVNVFRFCEGRRYRLWGARTISSGPEWKYANLRCYLIYLEDSIERGTHRALFEPNGEQFRANVRRTIEDFLLTEQMNGAAARRRAREGVLRVDSERPFAPVRLGSSRPHR